MRIASLFLFLVLSITSIYAQDDDGEYFPSPIPEQETEETETDDSNDEEFIELEDDAMFSYIFVGGQGQLGFSNIQSIIGFSPTFGVGLTDNLRVAAGPGYTRLIFPQDDQAFNIFGIRTFAEYHLFGGIFAHVEYDKQFLKARASNTVANLDLPWRGLVGGGYNSKGDFKTEGFEGTVEVLYDIRHDENKDVRSPFLFRASAYFTF